MKEIINDKITSFCYIPNNQWKILSKLAMEEDWSFKETESPYEFPVLTNYIYFTYQKLYNLYKKEPKGNWLIIDDKQQICFNTGLLTKNYEIIYMILTKADKKKNANLNKPYISKGFYKESDSEICFYEELPKRAKFINNLEDLIFDTSLKLVPNFEHILEDPENKKRIPESLRDHPNLISILNGEILRVKKRVDCNYKIAVPQCYSNRSQFLLPLSLCGNPNKTDLVLVVSKISEKCYKGYTCLTMDMAYNNARQISKPETDWLFRG